VSPNHVGSVGDRECCGRNAPGKSIDCFVARAQPLQEGLPGYSHNDGLSQQRQGVKMTQEGEVVVQVLAESDAWIDRDGF